MKILFKLPKILFSLFLLLITAFVLTVMYNIRFVSDINRLNSFYYTYTYTKNIAEDYKEVEAKLGSKDVNDEAYIKSLFADVDENTQKLRQAQPYLPNFAKQPCADLLTKLDKVAANREDTVAKAKLIGDPSKATFENISNLVK